MAYRRYEVTLLDASLQRIKIRAKPIMFLDLDHGVQEAQHRLSSALTALSAQDPYRSDRSQETYWLELTDQQTGETMGHWGF